MHEGGVYDEGVLQDEGFHPSHLLRSMLVYPREFNFTSGSSATLTQT